MVDAAGVTWPNWPPNLDIRGRILLARESHVIGLALNRDRNQVEKRLIHCAPLKRGHMEICKP
jgi:hypothetical protein